MAVRKRLKVRKKEAPDNPPISIIDAAKHEHLFLPIFGGNLETWKSWLAFLKVMFALPIESEEEREIIRQCTKRDVLPSKRVKEAWLVCGRRAGKALDVDTLVPTPEGYKRMGDLQTGDYVFGADGKPTRIVLAHPIEYNRPCYKVVFSDGTEIVADAKHEWVTHDKEYRKNAGRISKNFSGDELSPTIPFKRKTLDLTGKRQGKLTFLHPVGRKRNGKNSEVLLWLAQCDCGRLRKVASGTKITQCKYCACPVKDRGPRQLTTVQIRDTLIHKSNESNHAIAIAPAVQYIVKELPIPPYTLGAWLGDGNSDSASITTKDAEVLENIESDGFNITEHNASMRYGITGGLNSAIAMLGLRNNKHVPDYYLQSSYDQRLALLQGLMDTDGWVERGRCCFVNKNKNLSEAVASLATSLGSKVLFRPYQSKLYGKDCGTVYHVSFMASFPAFRLLRKLTLQKSPTKTSNWRFIISVEQVESRPVRCITVENSDGLFLATKNHVITHNSQLVAVAAAYLATFFDWRPYLSPGEQGTVMVIASDRKQARVIFRYLKACFDLPLFADLVERKTQELIVLKQQITIEVQTANYRTVRGYTILAALLDEIAFWRSEETANPDDEILAALRPAMATIPGAMMLCASSPYARRGVLWKTYKDYFGKPVDDTLVWQAATRVMNPSVTQEFIDKEYARDPAAADAEYGANFRRDIENYITIEMVEQVTDFGLEKRPYITGGNYCAFVDPSGGSRDSFTLAIAHSENGIKLLDCVEEFKPPFSPESVMSDMALVMKSYGITHCVGDRYAGEWPVEGFARHGIVYEPFAEPKNILYRNLLPLLTSVKVRLVDNPTLRNQLVSLERRTARGGRDIIDHPPGGHDDVVNAAAGALTSELEYNSADAW